MKKSLVFNRIKYVPLINLNLLRHGRHHDGRYIIAFDQLEPPGKQYSVISTCGVEARELTPKILVNGRAYSIVPKVGGLKETLDQQRLRRIMEISSGNFREESLKKLMKLVSYEDSATEEAFVQPRALSNSKTASKFTGGYIIAVIKDGIPAPASRPGVHPTEELAMHEAERLAVCHPGETFVVFKALSALSKPAVHRVDFK